MRHPLIIFIGLLIATSTLHAQVGEKLSEVSINMTALVSQVLPFQNSTTLIGPFHLYYKGGRNNRYFSFKLGAQVRDFEDGNFLNLAIGYNRRRQFGQKFDLDIGYHLMILGGSFNDPINNNDEGVGGIGLSWDLGFRYRINSRMSVGASTILFIGPTSNAFSLTFVPPVGIFLTGRLK